MNCNGLIRVACTASDANYLGEPGTSDEWCDKEGPLCDIEDEAIRAWNDMNQSRSSGVDNEIITAFTENKDRWHMNECDKELQEKINHHRKKNFIVCDPDCWCWSAQGTICLYQSAIEANKILNDIRKEQR